MVDLLGAVLVLSTLPEPAQAIGQVVEVVDDEPGEL